ncbi:MAG: carboxypeptidase-like regulatory domain-containing protein, partial [Niastella sp.]|uniref:carboxypeptidase-like regulatory domain-containing protein n=1 Tax=Niastella sp. TaxID=1869183 RepID=UPI00389A40FF
MIRIVTCIAFVLLGISPSFVVAQTKTLHGVVKSKTTGAPLAGVTVLGATVKNNSVTDASGNFSITAARNSILTISYVG